MDFRQDSQLAVRRVDGWVGRWDKGSGQCEDRAAWSVGPCGSWLMRDSASYIEIVSGRRRGFLASATRTAFMGASWAYSGILGVRNAWYDSWAAPRWLDVPVISVGNLTVGGTGKTPMCGWLCRRLLERGLKPAILSRGYKAGREGSGDEMLMLSRQYPEAVVVAHPDRYKAGQLATDCYGAKAVVLDDGFQHRRVGRDLDLVLIDVTRPFGFGHVLPRGLLREPLKGLSRADAVVLTRCDQADPEQVARLQGDVRRLRRGIPVVRSVHRAIGFTGLDGAPALAPQGSRIGALAGIARPEAFERTLMDMGIRPADGQWWPDHHSYAAVEVNAVREWINRSQLDAVVTTEKDAVKLAALNVNWPVPMIALHVEMEMLDDGEWVLSGLIDNVLKEHAGPVQVAGNDDGDADEKHSRD